MSRGPWLLGGAVGGHLLLSALHGWTHVSIPVSLPVWQYAVAGLLLGVGPLAGLALALAGRLRLGGGLVCGAGLLALAFEGVAHFVVAGPDHVGTVATPLFTTTAALTTLGDVLLVLAGALVLSYSHGRAVRSHTESST